MKNPKNVEKNPELDFYPTLIDEETGKICVGAVEVVIDGYEDEDGWEYITELYLAYQLMSGRIVYVEEDDPRIPMHVHSLKGKAYDLRWGYYPIGFKEEWQYFTAAPTSDLPRIAPVETEELPF